MQSCVRISLLSSSSRRRRRGEEGRDVVRTETTSTYGSSSTTTYRIDYSCEASDGAESYYFRDAATGEVSSSKAFHCSTFEIPTAQPDVGGLGQDSSHTIPDQYSVLRTDVWDIPYKSSIPSDSITRSGQLPSSIFLHRFFFFLLQPLPSLLLCLDHNTPWIVNSVHIVCCSSTSQPLDSSFGARFFLAVGSLVDRSSTFSCLNAPPGLTSIIPPLDDSLSRRTFGTDQVPI